MKDMEQGEELVPLAQRRAYLDTWVGLILSALNLDADGAKPMYSSVFSETNPDIQRVQYRWMSAVFVE